MRTLVEETADSNVGTARNAWRKMTHRQSAAVVWLWKPGIIVATQFIYQVWLASDQSRTQSLHKGLGTRLASGLREFSTFSYCAWSWNWLLFTFCDLSAVNITPTIQAKKCPVDTSFLACKTVPSEPTRTGESERHATLLNGCVTLALPRPRAFAWPFLCAG